MHYYWHELENNHAKRTHHSNETQYPRSCLKGAFTCVNDQVTWIVIGWTPKPKCQTYSRKSQTDQLHTVDL